MEVMSSVVVIGSVENVVSVEAVSFTEVYRIYKRHTSVNGGPHHSNYTPIDRRRQKVLDSCDQYLERSASFCNIGSVLAIRRRLKSEQFRRTLTFENSRYLFFRFQTFS
jgi:hypothetical protein